MAGQTDSYARFPAAESAPVAQLDRAPDYESGGQEFESLRARQQIPINTCVLCSHISQPSLEYENGRDTISRNRRAVKDPRSSSPPVRVPFCVALRVIRGA